MEEKWICTSCTLLNDATVEKCVACETVEDSDKEETEEAAKEGNGEKAEEGEGESKAKEEEAGTPESGAVAVAGPTNYQKRKLRDQQKKGRAKKVNKGAIDSLADQLAACSSDDEK
ncbi:hypothetical protein DAPPUDRAFT_108438 [Daphnia pulex]|uniref:RanBP2-type domain-containing protein n=1 Tax=Daphnia pulex TaxID=6669 RepID=E9H074_DAPPU|nr:hypothetical protein DAPPUDRAFT_108438 [Daphnia pulex]|eukprot:EFX74861.1 hypothetical protein DAPPUDRAFT_108438 [Daphnia pulex]